MKIYSRFETNKKFRLPYHLANEAVVLTVHHTTDSTLVSFPDPTSTSAEGLGMRIVTLNLVHASVAQLVRARVCIEHSVLWVHF